jgi:uncharacterized protein YukE
MKNKTNLLSSFIIALIAGFIYFQLGGVEDIKRIASLGFQMVSEPIEEITDTQLASNGIRINIPEQKKEKKSKLNVNENGVDMKKGLRDLAVIDNNSKIISFTHESIEGIEIQFYENSPLIIEGEITFSPEYYIPLSMNNNDVYLETIRVPDYEEYIAIAEPLLNYYKKVTPVRICSDDDPVTIIINDSNFIKPDFDRLEMDGFNMKLNVAMEKLNLALEKLSDNLRGMDFNFNDKKNHKEFKLKMKEFEEDMKEFELEMKEFGSDFKEDMKEFKEDMEEYKEDMEDFNKDMKEYKKEHKEKIKEDNFRRYRIKENCMNN